MSVWLRGLTAALAAGSAILASGCAGILAGPHPPAIPAPPFADRVLVVARVPAVEDRPIAERAAEMLAARLRRVRSVVAPAELLRAGGPPARRFVERLEAGLVPAPEESAFVLMEHGVATVLVVTVTTWDQVWIRDGKSTRVGVTVDLLDLIVGQQPWRGYGEVKLEHRRGRAFQAATEEVVAGLAHLIEPRTRSSIADAWRWWGR